MLTRPDEATECVSTAHRAKLAYIYVRQSTAVQVRQHQESTELQYRLVDRAAGLGWPRERIIVIDDDLGKSGASSAERQGFQRLIAEILHQIRMRLHQGERQKAARGALRMALPAGLVQERGGGIVLNPDEEVQARLRFVFDEFRALQSAKAVMRELQRHGLPLPVRPIRGPAPQEVVWVPADYSRVLNILHNPAYADTYAYGKRRQDPIRRRAGRSRCATIKVVVEQWPVCLRDAHPGYISWEEFMANQARLAGNVARHAAQRPGVPRQGCALLQGIAVCGRCGRRMGVRYSGPDGDYPVYHCSADQSIRGEPRCQEVRALNVDATFERVLLEALAPDQIAFAVAAVGQIEAESRALEHQWALKRERARYEAERARRQYDTVEPENRLVARSLERVWEEKLRQAEVIEQDYAVWRNEQMGELADTECAEVLGLAQDLLRVWQAATAEERKRILRLVVREVALDQKRERGLVWMRITWQTGATSEHRLRRRVQGYAQYADTAQLEQRVRELNAGGMMDREIAATLNAEGIGTAHGMPFAGGNVHVCRKRWGIATVKINGVEANPPRWPDGTYSVQGAAAALGITPQTVFKWLRKGRLVGRQLTKGQPWQITLLVQFGQREKAAVAQPCQNPALNHLHANLGLGLGRQLQAV